MPDEPSAETRASEHESRREVVAALRAPPKRQRDCTAVLPRFARAAIAETLGLSVNSVKTHLQRGLRSMAAALEESR